MNKGRRVSFMAGIPSQVYFWEISLFSNCSFIQYFSREVFASFPDSRPSEKSQLLLLRLGTLGIKVYRLLILTNPLWFQKIPLNTSD